MLAPANRPAHTSAGSTLVDLLAVLGIIGVLISITIPMLLSARFRSGQARCADHLRQVGLAFHAYARDHQGRLPSTRPAIGPDALPDLTNSGFAAADPFAPDGPVPNNVPAALFLLIRTRHLSADQLVCPATPDVPDAFAAQSPSSRSNFTDLHRNLSYSVQNPYPNDRAAAAGFRWTLDLPPNFAIAADRNPGSPLLNALAPAAPRDALGLPSNSPNHLRRGQNVLYLDGRVEWRDSPLAGIGNDNIYASRAGRLIDSPADDTDSILLPAAPAANP